MHMAVEPEFIGGSATDGDGNQATTVKRSYGLGTPILNNNQRHIRLDFWVTIQIHSIQKWKYNVISR